MAAIHPFRNCLVRLTAIALIHLFAVSSLFAQQEFVLEPAGSWQNLTGFAIHPDEKHLVVSVIYNEREHLFEGFSETGTWDMLQAIEAINNFRGGTAQIGSPSFNYDGDILYFSANFPGGEGGFDIYYSKRSADGWSEPVSMGPPVNTPADELHPFMGPGQAKFFFSRRITEEVVRRPRGSPGCQQLFLSYREPTGEWEEPRPLHEEINTGCAHGLGLAMDGKTIYYASVDPESHRDGYDIYFAREIIKGEWVLPVLVKHVTSSESNINPRLVGENFYFFLFYENRRRPIATIYRTSLPDSLLPLPTIAARGRVIKLENQKPLPTRLGVFDPTTLKVLGLYDTDGETGRFDLPLLDGYNYIVDIRSPGHSFASFQLDYRWDDKLFGPGLIELFEFVELWISLYDGEIFRPLEGGVFAMSQSDNNQKIISEQLEEGLFSLTLPLGHDYLIEAQAPGFHGNGFEISLKGDVIFSRFHRDLPLEPIKMPVKLLVIDSETRQGVNAEINIHNLFREENISFMPHELDDGAASTLLREEDTYEFSVRGAVGYSFYNNVLKIGPEHSTIIMELNPLRMQTVIRLNNIHFAYNSAELTSSSFQELDRVLDLMRSNPLISIEIAAHTDNIGSDGFNILLSERRAQSVVNYLLDNGIPMSRLTARGYGLRRPLVPNTTDENRALNRRVEFTIVDIQEQ